MDNIVMDKITRSDIMVPKFGGQTKCQSVIFKQESSDQVPIC